MEVISLMEKQSTDFDSKSAEHRLQVENGTGAKSIAGSVVALGKFDALHIGHRALAIQASRMGPPVLLSFSGMAEVLQWEKRLPVVASCDRKRVMKLWSLLCGGKTPQEYHLEFAKIRQLSPYAFVERLAKELMVKGVVAGANYRFGFKAAGDASDLVQLCGKFGLQVHIVNPVMDEESKLQEESKELETDSREMGQVSSTRVRKSLATGDIKHATELLGREHRLILLIEGSDVNSQVVHVQTSNALNQFPTDGLYRARLCLGVGISYEEANVTNWMSGLLKIEDKHVLVSPENGCFPTGLIGKSLVCIDLQSRISV
ncbi:hypothetical protein KP509_35G060500 [Ceratopteris richardii]|nr:hypothetical protein KP509_35G060500 [Ceratopteris richardii]